MKLTVGKAIAAISALQTLLGIYNFWPVWTAQTIPYEHWRWRMWFTSWI